MGRQPTTDWTEARAIVRNSRGEMLIVKLSNNEEAAWEFPGGRLRGSESPESALRRELRETLLLELNIEVGQPPFIYNFGGKSVTYRYYFCTVRAGEVKTAQVAEARWVLPQQLRDYVFEPPVQQVVDWILEAPDAI